MSTGAPPPPGTPAAARDFQPLTLKCLPAGGWLVLGGVLFLLYYPIFFVLPGLITALQEKLASLTPHAVYLGTATISFIMGSQIVVTHFVPAEERISRTRTILFAIPIGGGKLPFASVRGIDMDHPQSGKIPDTDRWGESLLTNYNRWNYTGEFFFGLTGSMMTYRLYIYTQNRDKLILVHGVSRKKMAMLAEQLARMTKTRVC